MNNLRNKYTLLRERNGGSGNAKQNFLMTA